MTKRTHLVRSAGSAIAAALALTSAPVLAQDVAAPPASPPPVTVAPPPAAAEPAPQPEMVSAPVVQETSPTIVVPDVPQAAPEEAASEPRAETPARSESAPARDAAPAPRAAPVADAAPDAPSGDVASAEPAPVVPPVIDAAPVGEPVAARTEAADSASEGQFALLVALLAAIAVVALAVWGFVAIGRRRHGRVAVPVVERPVVAERAPQPQPAAPSLAEHQASVTPLASPRPMSADSTTDDGLAHSGAAVALPRKMPETFAERDALLKRMIAARPDRANPFKSPLQRRRRAKLILQSLGRDFGNTRPWIDFSQYPSNWPSAARPASAAA